MTRKAKAKAKAPSLADQLSGPLKDFVMDFQAHGKEVLERVREESPSKYLELAAKLATLVATLRPKQDDYSGVNSFEELGAALLWSVGVRSPTPEQIEAAVAANDRFCAELETIAAMEGNDDDEGGYQCVNKPRAPGRMARVPRVN